MTFRSRFLQVIAFVLFVLLPMQTHAVCKSNVHYINGVLNQDKKEGEKVTERIKVYLKNHPTACVGDPLFNPSQDLLMDLTETYEMKAAGDQNFLLQFKDQFIAAWNRSWGNFFSILSGNKPDEYNFKQTLADMYAIIKPELARGESVMLMAHSEGNLFASELKKMAVADSFFPWRIEITHIAPPTKVGISPIRPVAVLASTDLVIKFLLNTNQSNFFPDTLLQPELGHGMMAVYLNEANTGIFVDYSCQRTATNTASLVLASIKKGAECLASACIALSASDGVC